MKKSRLTQELVNVFPPWARTRTSDQSVGYTMFNALAQPMERMQQALQRTGANTQVATANLDEIDLIYKAVLPVNYEFEQDTTDPIYPVPVVPDVTARIGSTWYTPSSVDPPTVKAFWYDSLPNRADIEDVVSGVDYELMSMPASGVTQSGIWEHHLESGNIWIECVGGVRYLQTVNGTLYRGRVVLRGINSQGIEDMESIIFPWDMKQRSTKEWQKITKVETYDMENSVEVIVTSANFQAPDRQAPYNLAFSENRKKIDTFYGLGTTTSGSTLERIGFVSDEWQQLIIGFIDKEAKERWELLDSDGMSVDAQDLALQPFTDRAWVVTPSGILYCYDTHSDMVSGFERIRGRTPGSEVQLDVGTPYVLLGEEIEFMPWHARPVQEIIRWRMWYETPSGVRYGLKDGAPVSMSSYFWVDGGLLKRNIGNATAITATERGEYLLVLEALFVDETTHTEMVLVPVNSKRPIATIDLTDYFSGINIQGIDFDANQDMWFRSGQKYYLVKLHSDVMLVDFDKKILYFKEPYEEVRVVT